MDWWSDWLIYITDKKGGNMYEKTLEKLEERLIGLNLLDVEEASKVADLIIKIKTIKYMDLQTDILEDSRRISKN